MSNKINFTIISAQGYNNLNFNDNTFVVMTESNACSNDLVGAIFTYDDLSFVVEDSIFSRFEDNKFYTFFKLKWIPTEHQFGGYIYMNELTGLDLELDSAFLSDKYE